MAYTKELARQCMYTASCRKRAQVEVFTYRNSSVGDYCRQHGKWILQKIERREKEGYNPPVTLNP